jgi:hypothetical protein
MELSHGVEFCTCKKCILKKLAIQHEQIKRLNERVCDLESVIKIFNNGEVTIGSKDRPINTIFVDTIVRTTTEEEENMTNKGICLDDTTSTFTPSFTSFPEKWLTTTVPIGSVRTYHYGTGVDNRGWVKWLMTNNIKVMIGITLNQYEKELELLQTDYAALKPLFDKNVLAIAIGNEQKDISAMIAGIAYAKNLRSQSKLPKVYITTVLENIWMTNTYPPSNATFTPEFMTLAPSLDIICFNMYDGYATQNPPINVRLSWGPGTSVTLNGFGAVRFAMAKAGIPADIPFWCTEVGWESSSTSNQSASIANLQTFYTNFVKFDTTELFTPQESNTQVLPPERIFYFTIRDTNSETFGLYTNDEALKPKF